MSTNTIESLLGSSQSQRSEMLESQGNTPRKKDEARRLQLRIRTFKGNLTTEIKKIISNIEHYEKKYPRDDEVDQIGTAKIDYATGILKSFDRATDRYVQLENALDQLKTLMSDTWEGTEDELDTAISKHNEGFQKYEKDYVEMTRKNDATIERCKDLLTKTSQAQSISENASPPLRIVQLEHDHSSGLGHNQT